MNFTIYNTATGQIIQSGICSDISIQAIPDGCSLLEIKSDALNQYIDNGQLINIPARPSNQHGDYLSKSWVINIELLKKWLLLKEKSTCAASPGSKSSRQVVSGGKWARMSASSRRTAGVAAGPGVLALQGGVDGGARDALLDPGAEQGPGAAPGWRWWCWRAGVHPGRWRWPRRRATAAGH